MLVTGSGVGIGIGRAAALAFVRAGYRVLVTDVPGADGNELVSTSRSAGGTASFFAMDVHSTQRVDEVIAAVNAECGVGGQERSCA